MIIERLDGKQYDILDYGLARLYHNIPSAEIKHTTATLDGLGEINISSTIDQRTITVDFFYQVKDIYDYYLLRDELNALFLSNEPFYIIFKREPYKKWLVKISEGYQIPPSRKGNGFTLKFRTVQKFAESIGDTTSIKEWDSGIWGWNDTINWDEDLKYDFTTSNFSVYNLGTAYLKPEEWKLEIIVTGVSNGEFKLVNWTTGDEYIYRGAIRSGDVLKIGVSSYKNGVSVFKDTNYKLISLAPGENKFSVHGMSSQNIKFNFKFPYM